MNRKRIFAGILAALLGCAFAGCETGRERPAVHTNSLGMEFALIPAGEFMMGSPEGEEDAVCLHEDEKAADVCRTLIKRDEYPRHRVRLTRPFYLGKYEVTQSQWEAVMNNKNHSIHKGPDRPVDRVCWVDAQEFIRRLNELEGHNRYRLPTEAEWEYAARAGSTTRYFFGDDPDELARYAWFRQDEAWFRENAKNGTYPVGQKEPNPWGLFDMYGNVREWAHDAHGTGDYRESPARDPRGWESSSPYSSRISRGGHYASYPDRCRSAARSSNPQSCRLIDRPRLFAQGFRLAMDVE